MSAIRRFAFVLLATQPHFSSPTCQHYHLFNTRYFISGKSADTVEFSACGYVVPTTVLTSLSRFSLVRRLDAACPVSNGRGGRPCNATSGQFDPTRCAVLDCNTGYYLNANVCTFVRFFANLASSQQGVCAAVPPLTLLFPWWGIVIVVVGALFVVSVIISVVVLLRRRTIRKKSGLYFPF